MAYSSTINAPDASLHGWTKDLDIHWTEEPFPDDVKKLLCDNYDNQNEDESNKDEWDKDVDGITSDEDEEIE